MSVPRQPVTSPSLSIEECVTLACLLEATPPKPGNVHRGADFDDLGFVDFAVSAALVARPLAAAQRQGIGHAVLEAVERVRDQVGTNVYLGTILLLAPLCRVPRHLSLKDGIEEALGSLTPEDSRRVYQAIRTAGAGGLDAVDKMDIRETAPESLVDAMRAAADRDLVARQYTNGFAQVLDEVLPNLVETSEGLTLVDAVVHTHVTFMHLYPDSLIARKCGRQVAEQSAALAGRVLQSGEPGSELYLQALHDLDFWLRSDGHRRNPGTTADLIAAGLFAGLREGTLRPPGR